MVVSDSVPGLAAPAADPYRWVRRVVVAAGALLLIAASALLALPEILRAAIPWWLAEARGVESSIDHVSLDVWNGRAALHGLRLGPDDGVALQLDRLRARFDVNALLSGEPPLRGLSVGDGTLDVDAVRRVSWRSADPSAAGDAAEGERPASVWLPDVDVSDLRMLWLSKGIGQDVIVRRLRVAAATKPARDGTLAITLDLRIGGAPLTLVASADGLDERPRLEGRMNIDGLSLAGMQALASEDAIERLAGIVRVDSSLSIEYDPHAAAAAVDVDGAFGVDGLRYAADGVEVDGDASYDGRVALTWSGRLETLKLGAVGESAFRALRATIDGRGDVGDPMSVSAENLRYQGELGFDPEPAQRPRAHGRVQADTLGVDIAGTAVSADGIDAAMATVVDGESAALSLASTDGSLLNLELKATAGGVPAIAANAIRLSDLRAAIDGRVAVQRVEVRALSSAATERTPGWRVDGLTVDGFQRDADGTLSLAAAKAAQIDAGTGDTAVQVKDAALGGVARAASGDVSLSEATVASLVAQVAGAPAEVGMASMKGARVAADGAIAVEHAEVERATHALPDGTVWEASRIVADSVALDVARNLRLSSARLGRASLMPPGSQPLDQPSKGPVERAPGTAASGIRASIEQGEVQALEVDRSGAVRADAVQAAKVVAELATGDAIDVGSVSIGDLRIDGASDASVARVSSGAARLRQRGGATVALSGARLDELRAKPGPGNAPEYAVQRVRVDGIDARGPQDGARIRLASASAERVAAGTNRTVVVDTLRTGAFRLGSGDEPALRFAAFEVDRIEYAPSGAIIGAVHVDDLQGDLARSADGALVLPALPFTTADASSTAAAAGKPFPVRVASFETRGDTRFRFVDREPDPPFEIRIDPLSVRFEGIATKPGAEPGRFEVQGRLGEFSRLDLGGQVEPLAGGVDLSFAGRFTGVDLGLLSPYTKRYQNFSVERGRADLKVDGELRAGAINAKTGIVISKLQLGAAAPAASGPGTAQAKSGSGSLPLSTALALLKDDNDTVRLDVPISGSLADPKFDFSDAIGQAVAKAATGAVMIAFQPLGLAISAAKIVGGVKGLGFEPVPFEAADTELSAESITRLDALAETLAGKRTLKLAVCGRAAPADAQALARAGKPAGPDALRALAGARGERVRAYLAQHGLGTGQVGACEPAIDGNFEPGPRAEIVLDAAGIPRAASTGEPGPVGRD